MAIPKRTISAFVLFLLNTAVIAQTVTIKWSEPATVLDVNFKPVDVLYFEGAQTEANLWSYYVLILKNKSVKNISIVNAKYLPVSDREAAIINNKDIPSDVHINVSVENSKPVSIIRFVPVVKNNQTGAYEKIISFDYQVELESFTMPAVQKFNQKKNGYASNAKTNAAGSSVLANGSWYKVAVSETGMYKMDYNYLKSIGINPDIIDPRTIQVFGNGGGMLPQANILARPDDLLENSIVVIGEGDGKFDVGDYVLFYAKGPNAWTFNVSESVFNHAKNLYSDFSYYFITYGAVNGTRVQNLSDLGSGLQTITYFDDYVFHENDQYNLLSSGREWYGDLFDQNTFLSFPFNSSGIINGSTLKLKSSVMSSSTSATSFNLSVNSAVVGTQNIAANNLSAYDAKGIVNTTTHNVSVSGSPATLSIGAQYNKGSSFTSKGYLNYLALNFQRTLNLYGNQTSFRTIASTNTATTTYQIGNATGTTLWRVSDIQNIENCLYSLSGTTAVFSSASVDLEEFVVFSGNGFPAPTFISTIANQNLHSVNAPSLPDMVIVTYPEFSSQANRLADFRRSNDGLDVLVVSTEQVYNEFSSGAQDITAIRDFMKMLYDRRAGSDSIRYLLLFGDASYDFKNRIPGNTNFVPTYESRESLFPLLSYSSDDYFGFLDNTEGNWGESPTESDRLDIGVGRIPVKNTQEAEAVVNKLIHYSGSASCLGKWRNVITFAADDGDNNLHLKDANDMSIKVDADFKLYNINKIYLDAFPQVASPGGEKAPEVSAKIDQTINKGTFIFNYSGHGGETLLAQENILTISQMDSWSNINALPFMITATCDFGRCDDPAVVSGMEYGMLKGDGGIVGGITSARIVYAFSNKALNLQIYNNLFKPLPNGEKPRQGDVIRQTKNASIVGVNNRNYYLVGDPSLRLVYPSEDIAVTHIKGVAVSTDPDTLKALSKVTIKGDVRNAANAKISDFNGSLNITIYDKKNTLTTLGTEGSAPYSFKLQNNFLFDGSATISNGEWTVTFVVPKDISYQYDFGKISTYAIRNGSINDAGGFYTNVIIGGTDPNAPEDNTPPQIRLYMNDESFVFGGLTGKNPLFLAKLSDENGINTAGSGVGHEITVTLDNSEKPVVLNEFYTANLNDYQNGSVKYPFKDLTSGIHHLKFKAWDTYNNSSEAYLEFVVANDERIALSHILNYPNPFSTYTVFHFDHNRAGEELDVMIQVYTVTGKLIKTLDTKVLTGESHFSGLDWNGRDDYGDKIGRGVYVYRVWVRAPRDGSSVFKYEKLVILN